MCCTCPTGRRDADLARLPDTLAWIHGYDVFDEVR